MSEDYGIFNDISEELEEDAENVFYDSFAALERAMEDMEEVEDDNVEEVLNSIDLELEDNEQ